MFVINGSINDINIFLAAAKVGYKMSGNTFFTIMGAKWFEFLTADIYTVYLQFENSYQKDFLAFFLFLPLAKK
jgi:hypothetical protein